MPKNEKTESALPSKMIVAVRQDLVAKVVQMAKDLEQNPNQFVNLCLEGCMKAMEAKGTEDIPIVKLYRTITGRTFYTSKTVMKIVSVVAPEVEEMDAYVHSYWLDLISKHEGSLNMEILQSYYKVAIKMNMERVAREKEIKKIQAKASNL